VRLLFGLIAGNLPMEGYSHTTDKHDLHNFAAHAAALFIVLTRVLLNLKWPPSMGTGNNRENSLCILYLVLHAQWENFS
jgi:hypothetical protein